MADETVQKELADWIDTDVIAENILEHLKEEGFEPTVENAKKLWLDFLETELHEGIKGVLNYSPAFGN